MNKSYRRDTRGRFRKPTDEERWPDPVERERMQSIRALLTPSPWLMREMARVMAQQVRDLSFVGRYQWP